MTRFHGVVGYGISVETPPGSGKWVDQIVSRPYYGEVLRDSREQTGDGVNKDIVINNRISILADPLVIGHFKDIKYVEWVGKRWTVPTVEVQTPRLILTIGGVYNGPTA